MQERIEIIKNRKKKYFSVFVFIILFILLIFYLFFKKNTKVNEIQVLDSILKTESKSIFNIKDLNHEILNDKFILLNIYDIRDFSYIFSLKTVEKIEKKFKNKITIIDVVFDEDFLKNNIIINYILKNNIERPVISISKNDLKNIIDINNNYFVLIDNKGIIQREWKVKDNKNIIEDLKFIFKNVKKINEKNIFELAEPDLEKNKIPETFIKSFNHIIYIVNEKENIPYFVLVDSKGKKIYLSKLNGNITKQIGNGREGDVDGFANNAEFCHPFDVVSNENFLYISDTCNDSIKSVNLDTLEVKTILTVEKPLALSVLNNNLLISTATQTPLLKYNLESKKLEEVSCDVCSDDIINFSNYNHKVYFINSKDNILYSINNKDKINKEIDFNELNKNNEIKIKDNFNFHIDETGFYFVDKFNNKIVHILKDKIQDYSTNNFYNIPTDIISVKDKLYITNENDKKLIQLDKNTKEIKIINFGFGYEYNKFKTDYEDFLSISNIDEILLKPNENSEIILDLKDSYSFEKMAPQTLSIFKEDKKNNTALLIKTYTKNEILKNKKLKLPLLENDSVYYIKSIFYYCNYSEKTPCLIRKYNKKIKTGAKYNNTDIIINFLY